jgi:hypothetical protein
MNHPIELDRFRQEMALAAWQDDCKARMAVRYPKVAYDSDTWRPRREHGVDISDVHLEFALADFAGRDPGFTVVLRCLAAENVLANAKDSGMPLGAFRLLSRIPAPAASVFDISLAELRRVEDALLAEARVNPTSAHRSRTSLLYLCRQLALLQSKAIIPPLHYRMRRETRSELIRIEKSHYAKRRRSKASLLDSQIEAFNEVCNAWADDDPRLEGMDRQAIATAGLLMVAPSRINEPLCMSVDDMVTIDDYARRSEDKGIDELHAAHQLLLMMKGSKGAQWSAKPVLNFMIDFLRYCMETIKAGGKRSRMLIEWYQENPETLYLPGELEYLRGQDISVADLDRIMRLGGQSKHVGKGAGSAHLFFRRHHSAVSREGGRNGQKQFLPWPVVEAALLENVRQAIADCREVSRHNHYLGNLARMLCLCDHNPNGMPYLPGALKYESLKNYFHREAAPSIFRKLGITMPVNGAHEIAWMNTHDPRRWLTTMALIHGMKLSDVLINKWANRLRLSQLWAYDLRTDEQKADASAMPDAVELKDLSQSLASMRHQQDAVGLAKQIIEVHDIGVTVTSMAAIHDSSANRPFARTAEQIVVLYATWFGCCPHQHHEKPCRAYASCLPCDEHFVVKGYLPTNEHIRERKDQLFGSILAEVERLMVARNRGIADDPDGLDTHLLALVRQGLTPEQMTAELIERFQELKALIVDVVFRNRLEEAFVATGYVRILDDDRYPSGSHIKYNNPSRHASPGLERGLDALGGRKVLTKKIEDYFLVYPEFAPTALGLKDESHLLPGLDEGQDAPDEEQDDD